MTPLAPLVGLALVAALVPAGSQAEARRTPLSRELARELATRLGEVEARWRAGQQQASSLRVSEAELNSWLSYEVGLPASLSDVEVRLERDRVAGEAWLDLDQLQERLPRQDALVSGLLALVSGKVRVLLSGKLVNDEEPGFGSLEIEQVSLGAIPISPASLAPIVASATRSPSRPGGFDILAPFRFPYGVKRVRLRAGRAVLDF